jgi:CheY-like chemotaxis protein
MSNIRKVFIIDDNVDILDIYKSVLESEGYIVTTARNGVEALAQIKELAPDLIFLDIMMPGKSGLDVLTTLRTDTTYVSVDKPIIMLTNATDSEVQAEAKQRGASMYVIKSTINNEQLVDIVRSFEASGTVQA